MFFQILSWPRAAAYGKMGEHDKSLADCRKALELDPRYCKAYARKGYEVLRSSLVQFDFCVIGGNFR